MAIETQFQPSSTRYITYEEYLQDEGENHHTEWVNGKAIDISMVTAEHDDVSGFIQFALRIWVLDQGLGVIHADPFNMKTGPNLPGRAPDIMVVTNANVGRLRRLFLDGPCDLAVEIVSPESRTCDTVDKFQEYAEGGVPEYWICDPERRHTRFYALNATGQYEEIAIGSDGIFHSRVLPGLWLNVNWLWQRPFPTSRDLLRIWGLL